MGMSDGFKTFLDNFYLYLSDEDKVGSLGFYDETHRQVNFKIPLYYMHSFAVHTNEFDFISEVYKNIGSYGWLNSGIVSNTDILYRKLKPYLNNSELVSKVSDSKFVIKSTDGDYKFIERVPDKFNDLVNVYLSNLHITYRLDKGYTDCYWDCLDVLAEEDGNEDD